MQEIQNEKKILRGFFAFSFVFILIFLSYFIIYFYIEIYPKKTEIDSLLSERAIGQRVIQKLESITLCSSERERITRFVSKSFAKKYIPRKNWRDSWHLLGVNWHIWISFIYSKDEIFLLWTKIIPFSKNGDNEQGLNNAAKLFFGKNINSLNLKELTTLVAAAESPTRFKPGTPKSNERVNAILKSCSAILALGSN